MNAKTAKELVHKENLDFVDVKFVDLFGLPKRPIALGSGHGSPKKSI